eukprot:TRINITY_DN7649_c0_g1_i1.p1 TRINITY_DN7649_c0_g1~~TRINITY_DN7649_c0_g1_i1.p1  ORF type:complete len:273 (-),score=33.36 TRINITY_DN7649_c0_g1_i1:355-1173(-)
MSVTTRTMLHRSMSMPSRIPPALPPRRTSITSNTSGPSGNSSPSPLITTSSSMLLLEAEPGSLVAQLQAELRQCITDRVEERQRTEALGAEVHAVRNEMLALKSAQSPEANKLALLRREFLKLRRDTDDACAFITQQCEEAELQLQDTRRYAEHLSQEIAHCAHTAENTARWTAEGEALEADRQRLLAEITANQQKHEKLLQAAKREEQKLHLALQNKLVLEEQLAMARSDLEAKQREVMVTTVGWRHAQRQLASVRSKVEEWRSRQRDALF